MTPKGASLVRVRVERNAGEWTVATCEDIPGLFISHPDRSKVISDIPATIRALFKAQYGLDVVVVALDAEELDAAQRDERSYAAIPSEVLAAAQAR